MSQGFVPPPYGPAFQPPQPPAPQPYAGAPSFAGSPGRPPAPAPPPQTQPYPQFHPSTGPPQRPAVIALGSTLAVVASLQWICGLSLLWMLATVATGSFAQVGDNGALFHILNRFHYRMVDGLAVPLYLFPLASFITGFLILSRRPWTRTLHTALGLIALAWAAWWLRDNLLFWFSGACYVVVACLVLWTPSATAWYRWRQQDAARTFPAELSPSPPAGRAG